MELNHSYFLYTSKFKLVYWKKSTQHDSTYTWWWSR